MTAPTAQAAGRQEGRFDLAGVATIAAGHLLHDTFSSFLGPLLPLLIAKLSISLALAGSLTLFAGLPSLFQPFIGYVAERVNLRFFIILAPIFTATLMSLLGRAPNLGILILLVCLYGLSSAAFHASAPATIGHISGRRLGLGLSIFTMSGELARTIGPLIIVSAVSWWTLEGTYRLIVLGLVASALLFWRLHGTEMNLPHQDRPAVKATIIAMRPMLLPLAVLLSSRAFLLTATLTFLPTYLTSKGMPYQQAGMSSSVVELAGVVGVMLGGPLSDRWGRRIVLSVAFLVGPLALLAFLRVWGWPIYPLLVLGGFFSLSTMPVLMAVVQERYAHIRATANGVYMALAFIIGALSSVAIGSMGDWWGLTTAFIVSAAVGLAGIPFVFMLPRSGESLKH